MTHPLMQYLPPQPKAPVQPQGGAGKYHGPIAQGYDAKRVKDDKWVCEQRLIEDMLSDLPAGSAVLDCPVGTGRFLEFYLSKGFKFLGMDISGDMLIQSALKIGDRQGVEQWVANSNKANTIMALDMDGKGELRIGDVRNTKLPDKCVDAAVMCRLTRWMSPEDCQKALRELQRVCRQRVIWTARVANHKHARSRELFEAALDGWKITHAEPGYVLDYVIFQARPA